MNQLKKQTKVMIESEYAQDLKLIKKEFWNRILREIIFDIIIIIVGFSQGIFSNHKTLVIGGVLFLISIIYSIYILNRRFKIIFKSISFNIDSFHLRYLHFLKEKEVHFKKITAETKIKFTHYSTKTTLPIRVKLSTEYEEYNIYFLLKEAILLFHFLEKHGGIVKKDFEFRLSLKELKTNKEYEDVYAEIDDLLK